jgi:predicted metal-dependent hydrolase
MSVKTYYVQAGGGKYEVECTRKRIIALRLRVLAGGLIRLSVPYGVGEPTIKAFLSEKSEWISQAVARVNAISPKDQEMLGKGILPETVRILGKTRKVETTVDDVRSVAIDGDRLIITMPELSVKLACALLGRWMRSSALLFFKASCDKYYPILGLLGHRMPTLKVRDMKTRWGSCNRVKGLITLSLRLYSEKPEFVDYVMMHELAHLEHPDHQAGFKRFLSSHMPDWKARKALTSRRTGNSAD